MAGSSRFQGLIVSIASACLMSGVALSGCGGDAFQVSDVVDAVTDLATGQDVRLDSTSDPDIVSDAAEICVPDCTGLECGPDPVCGQSCGTCDDGYTCQSGECEGVCVGGECLCEDGGVVCGDVCIDPFRDANHCGAKGLCNEESSASENYSGRICPVHEVCEEGACVCPSEKAICDNTCIDPKVNKTHCGAKGSCDASDAASDNYAGVTCQGSSVCVEAKCECPSASLICNGTCIDPNTDTTHCGAKGSCVGSDPDIENYQGVDCGSERYCHESKCKCRGSLIWCDGKCIDPDINDAFCGAKGKCNEESRNDSNFKGMVCGEKSYCLGGECVPLACDDTKTLCRNADGKLGCFDLASESQNCGQCGWNCEDKVYDSLKSRGTCVNSKCQYECAPLSSCTNTAYCNTNVCGIDTAHYPGVVCSADVYKTAAHCGGCDLRGDNLFSPCEDSEPVCVDGSKGYKCSNPDAEGDCLIDACFMIMCKNRDTACGRSCVDCTKLPYVAAAKCSEARICIITQCKETFHPSSDGSHCVPNTPEACAHADTTSETAVDCTGIANAASVACTVEGNCLVNSCKPGFHISPTQDACIVNEPSACGRVTAFGNEVRDCTLNAAKGAALCNASGICEVSQCLENYHLSLDKRRCEDNSPEACGAVDSSALDNCTRYGANYKCIAGKCEESY